MFASVKAFFKPKPDEQQPDTPKPDTSKPDTSQPVANNQKRQLPTSSDNNRQTMWDPKKPLISNMLVNNLRDKKLGDCIANYLNTRTSVGIGNTYATYKTASDEGIVRDAAGDIDISSEMKEWLGATKLPNDKYKRKATMQIEHNSEYHNITLFDYLPHGEKSTLLSKTVVDINNMNTYTVEAMFLTDDRIRKYPMIIVICQNTDDYSRLYIFLDPANLSFTSENAPPLVPDDHILAKRAFERNLSMTGLYDLEDIDEFLLEDIDDFSVGGRYPRKAIKSRKNTNTKSRKPRKNGKRKTRKNKHRR